MQTFKKVCGNCQDPNCNSVMLKCEECGRITCEGEVRNSCKHGIELKPDQHVYVMGHGNVWACGPLKPRGEVS